MYEKAWEEADGQRDKLKEKFDIEGKDWPEGMEGMNKEKFIMKAFHVKGE